MISGKKLIRLIAILITGCLVFFLSSAVLSFFLDRYNDPARITSRLNTKISHIQKEVSGELKKINSRLVSNGMNYLPRFVEDYKNEFIRNGRIYHVYLRDSLVAWSDNVFPVPEILDTVYSALPFQRGSNGYYLKEQFTGKEYTVVGLQIIKYTYRFNNELLPHGFYHRLKIPDNTEITPEDTDHKVYGKDGKQLFSLTFGNSYQPDTIWVFLIFLLFTASYLCLIAALFISYVYLIRMYGHRMWLIIFFFLDAAIIRALQFYFRFPGYLHSTELFSPVHFASSSLIPSLGDMMINTILFLQLSFYFFRYFLNKHIKEIRPSLLRIGGIMIAFAAVFIVYEAMKTVMESLVMNSGIPLQFYNLISLDEFSVAGLVIIVAILFSFMLITESLIRLIISLIDNKRAFWIFFVSSFLIYSIWSWSKGSDLILVAMLFSLFLIISIRQVKRPNRWLRSPAILIVMLVVAIIGTYIINSLINEKEKAKREIMASHLSDSRDKLAEYYYRTAATSILEDTTLAAILTNSRKDSFPEANAVSYLEQKYFQGFWKKYHIQVTLCRSGKKLSIQPENRITECESYFDDQIKRYLRPIDSPGLYFLKQSVDLTYYLGKLSLAYPAPEPYTLFIEIDSKNANKGLGYPELLMDRSFPASENLAGYSYAFYFDGELVKNVGRYAYNVKQSLQKNSGSESRFYEQNGYSHLVHPVDPKTILILSRELPGISDLIAPFSFIFIFLALCLFFILLVTGNYVSFSNITLTFRLRLQVFMVAIILGSSVLMGFITLVYLNQLNINKNKEIITEKMNTILVELENKLGGAGRILPEMYDELDASLISLSNTNFTDINIYGQDAYLVASSRSQIFENGLISVQLNPIGLVRLQHDQKSFFIQKERIGNYKFLSAYAPLRNYENKLIGYVNLPYFARQEDLRQEMSRLLTTYANIYIIMTALAVFMALLISRYFTRPLQVIRTQLGNLQLGRRNAKVEWNRSDEIGDLVSEYNRMIDELARSAELLAKSERESAWREMARQVAHEIKNPLTPIKLSIQHLIKAWDDRAPDWEIRLQRFSQTLIQQIETLSAIATEFSDFAQMPPSDFQQIDIQRVISHSAQLFRDIEQVSIQCPETKGVFNVYADENQMLRVFNNLFKNAIQAIPPEQKGIISIHLEHIDNKCLIRFTDNGSGIPTEQQGRIFSPNFTTKTAGMGLGLAMVKNIIDNSGGKIWFESRMGAGTTFYILLPSRLQA